MSVALMLCFIDFAKVMSLDTRLPPAMENAHPPMSISTMKMDTTVLLNDYLNFQFNNSQNKIALMKYVTSNLSCEGLFECLTIFLSR